MAQTILTGPRGSFLLLGAASIATRTAGGRLSKAMLLAALYVPTLLPTTLRASEGTVFDVHCDEKGK